MDVNAHYVYHSSDGGMEKMQLAYVDIYFIVYTYAMIGFMLTLGFILLTEIMIRWEEYKINRGI